MTVMLLYWTAEVEADGTVYFRKDIYNRDPAVIEGLNEPIRFSLPGGGEDAVGLRGDEQTEARFEGALLIGKAQRLLHRAARSAGFTHPVRHPLLEE